MNRLSNMAAPVGLLRVLVLTTGLALAISGGAVIVFMDEVNGLSRDASDTARAALRASKSEAELAKLRLLLERRIDHYLASAPVTALPADQQAAIETELRRSDSGPPRTGMEAPAVGLTLAETIAVRDAAAFLSNGYDEFADDAVRAAGEAGSAALDRYLADPTPGNLRLFLVQIDVMLEELNVRVAELEAETAGEDSRLLDGTERAMLGILLALGLCGVFVLLLGGRITAVVRRAMEMGQEEQRELEVMTERLKSRNDQLNALYNVFTEITDTLSLAHVVNAALREAMNIMLADMATLRILRGDELIVAGAKVSTGQDIKSLPPVRLGVGPTGRVAKRGRSLRIEEGGESMMSGQPGAVPGQSPAAQTNRSPMESGLIVPLVVGARVVGTLACWSAQKGAFREEDQRLLEMMASQVATAIAAADATEASERRAHQDALTSLPNRRQLDHDLDGNLARLAAEGRCAVVAMLDIDYFKRLNDKHGHQAGDLALRRIAGVLRDSVREGDRVYRFGGEEFVVVFTDTGIDEAVLLAERLRGAVQSAELANEEKSPVESVTMSIGLAILPEHGQDVSELIDLADKAMYRAKSKGGNCVEVWSQDGEPANIAA